MKLRSLIASTVLATTFFCSLQAKDQNLSEGMYVSARLGGRIPSKIKIVEVDDSSEIINQETRFGFNGSLSLGYRMDNGFRTEAEAAYQTAPFKQAAGRSEKTSLNSYKLMANVLYDLDLGSSFVPYAGLGLGMAKTSLEGSDGGEFAGLTGKAKFAYQAIVGASLPLTEKLAISMDYRYFTQPSLKLNDIVNGNIPSKFKMDNHLISVGIAANF